MSNWSNYEEIEHRFTFHKPKWDWQSRRYDEIRKRVLDTAQFIRMACPDSPELEKAIDKLDEAVMWANASIARRE